MNRVTVISYQDELLRKAKSLEEKKFVKALFPAIGAANSKIMGYLMNTPIMEIYPSKLREISGNTFKYRLERGIASNFKGSMEGFQYKFWYSESVEDFIESYTKRKTKCRTIL